MDQAEHDRIEQYIRDLFGQEDDHLTLIRARSEEEGLPKISVDPEEGRLLQFLIRLSGAKRVVEVGTLAGYSGTWMARALPPDGRLITLERDERHAAVARELFDQAGLSDRVEVRLGSALDTLKRLSAEGPFDAVFIDANKDAYPEYLEWAVDNVRIGGLIMGHNALWSGRVVNPAGHEGPQLDGLLNFNRRLSEDSRLLGILIPMGDGLAAAVRVQ